MITPPILHHRLSRRPSLAKPFPTISLLIRLPVLGLAWLAGENQLVAATTVTITNDWAAAAVRLVAPKPPAAPVYEWSDARQGEAVADLMISQSQNSSSSTVGAFAGSAIARIGTTVVSNDTIYPGYSQVFGSHLLADDSGSCEAQATIDSIWKMTVTGDSAPFYARGFVEMGHSMDFTVYDSTTGQSLLSKTISGAAGFNQLGTLEPSHDYLLTLRQRALFGGGDGQVKFGFGFSDPVLVEFSPNRTHLPIPEPSCLSLLAVGALLLVRRHRAPN